LYQDLVYCLNRRALICEYRRKTALHEDGVISNECTR
jgi:hypothetical protein